MAGGKTAQVTVFNPLSWRREDWLEVDVPLPTGTEGSLGAQQNGRPVPCHLIAAQSGTNGRPQSSRLAIRVDLPGLACASYTITAGAAKPAAASGVKVDAQRLSLRTRDWSIRLDPQGGIAEWRNLRTGHSILRAGQRGAFFAGRIENRDCESAGRWSVLPGPHATPWVTAREKGEIGGIGYVFDLTVRPDSPRLDCHVVFQIDNQRIGLVSEEKRDADSAFVHEHNSSSKWSPPLAGWSRACVMCHSVYRKRLTRMCRASIGQPLHGNNGIALFNRGAMGSEREGDEGSPSCWHSLCITFGAP